MREEELIERLAQLELIVNGIQDAICELYRDGAVLMGSDGVDFLKPCHSMIHDYAKKYTLIETGKGRSNRFRRYIDSLSK